MSGNQPWYDSLKIGYDNNSDNDIDDAGDDLIMNDDFDDTSVTVSHDHAGNLIDDGTNQFVYDAWNRLVKVRSAVDTDVTLQTSEFDGQGRRIKKVVTNTGQWDGTTVFLFDGQKIIETRDGSGNLVQQFIHGTQYIDELVMMRAKSKGDLYVHQDANWNVIALTDLGGSIVERNVYTPYGEVTVHQETSYGDRDGDGDVDSTDKGTVGTTCTGTVSGACRILDLDYDGDYDSTDASLFDSLPSGLARHPGRFATGVSQPFAHQGLLYEPEITSYQNRARQYDPGKRRSNQRALDSLEVSLLRITSKLQHLHIADLGDVPSTQSTIPFTTTPSFSTVLIPILAEVIPDLLTIHLNTPVGPPYQIPQNLPSTCKKRLADADFSCDWGICMGPWQNTMDQIQATLACIDCRADALIAYEDCMVH